MTMKFLWLLSHSQFAFPQYHYLVLSSHRNGKKDMPGTGFRIERVTGYEILTAVYLESRDSSILKRGEINKP